ncbi:GIN domain-containing protein [Flavobacterium luteum]|uniref:Putative auto-transporter adhesin head GIN domain-containing protein n=1 Tax=Flavobacterium luteum TaxID=2026654 RepID=A0A7J5AC69_9FLAO|nr:DUF2807 domain-containing protein [Flavobacterium luteum]KAB1155038.1 hypothetical protein F6464_11490 [Flavobacterium luteum]
MLKIITTLTLILIGLVAKSQEVENRKVSDFSKVEVQNGIELIYTENDQFSLQIELQNNASKSNVVTEVKGKKLKIYLPKGNDCNKSKGLVKVYLSSKNVAFFKASLYSKIIVTNQISTLNSTVVLNSESVFNGNIKNEGKTKIVGERGTVFNGKIETQILKGNFKDNAKANITGMAIKANLLTNDTALCNAKNFVARSLSITAEGNTIVLVYSDSKIVVTVADKAKVTYTGLPETIQLNDEAESLYKLKSNQALSVNY